MTNLETLREELAAKTRALATAEAECERLRSQVIPDQALSEMLADAQRHGGASASALWRSRVDGLTEERDALRADLQKQTKRARDAEVERDKLQNRLAGTLPKGGHDSSPALVVERLKDRLIAKAGETVEQAALRVVLESDRRRSDNQKLREDLDSERAMNAKLTEEGDTLRAQLADAAQIERDRMQAELARFQRADVGERVREIEEESREQSFTVMRMLADGRLSKDELINVPGLAIKMCEVVNERGELLAICRQQQAEIEQLKAEAEADKLARKESRAAQDLENLRLYWEGIRERFNRLPRFFLRDEDKAKRRWFFCVDDVLSALEPVVKESLTTERNKPVCSHCNDTQRDAKQALLEEALTATDRHLPECLKARKELHELRSRLTACDPVIELVRDQWQAYQTWNAALPSYLKGELWAAYQRKVAKLRESDLVLPAKVTT